MVTKARNSVLRGFILFLFLLAPAVAGTRDPNTPDDKYLEFGRQFPNVVRVRAIIRYEEKDTYQFGSAVIIRPHWVLTAAHVVENTREPVVFLDDESRNPVNTFIIHEDFENIKVGYHDIALGYCEKDFGMKFYPALYTDSDEMGKPVTIAGYGVTGTFLTGATEGDGLKRAGHNKIEGTERAVLVCRPDRERKFPLEFIIAPGDSGGGLFIGNKLAGINSFVMAVDDKPNGSYSDEAAHTRMSLYADWVNNQIKLHEAKLTPPATIGDEVNKEVNEPK